MHNGYQTGGGDTKTIGGIGVLVENRDKIKTRTGNWLICRMYDDCRRTSVG